MTTIPYSTTAAICQGSSKSRDEGEESIRDVSISDAHIPVEVPPLDAPIDLPPVTALLGQCEDTLPVLFDLADSRPGPLLILGDAGCGKQRLLVQIAESLIEGNPPDDIRFTIVSSHPDKW